MILDFSRQNLAEFDWMSRVNTLRFNGCYIRVHQDTAQIGSGFCTLCKVSDSGKINYFGPFDYRENMWKVKALMTALQGDELNKRHLATLTLMRLTNESS